MDEDGMGNGLWGREQEKAEWPVSVLYFLHVCLSDINVGFFYLGTLTWLCTVLAFL